MHAVGDNPDSAQQMGINVKRVRVKTFVFVGFGAACAGVFSTMINFTWWPTAGDGYLLPVLASVFVGGTPTWGGIGTVVGGAIGALTVSFIQTGIVGAGLSGFYVQFFNGLIIILSLLGHRWNQSATAKDESTWPSTSDETVRARLSAGMSRAEEMKITALETVRLEGTPEPALAPRPYRRGLTGLGETFFGARTVEEHMHEYVAPRVIGRDPLAIDRLPADLIGYLGLPLHRRRDAGQLGDRYRALGHFRQGHGPAHRPAARRLHRGAIRTYNTCAGTDYIKNDQGQTTANYGLGAGQRLRRSRRLPAPRRRAGPVAARRGHHRDEDLAVRPCRREDRRPVHLGRRI